MLPAAGLHCIMTGCEHACTKIPGYSPPSGDGSGRSAAAELQTVVSLNVCLKVVVRPLLSSNTVLCFRRAHTTGLPVDAGLR